MVRLVYQTFQTQNNLFCWTVSVMVTFIDIILVEFMLIIFTLFFQVYHTNH